VIEIIDFFLTNPLGLGITHGMKILLIYPYVLEKRIHEEDISIIPIGLYYIGALLIQHGYQVRILNGYGLNTKKNEIKELIASYQPNVIGFSILNANRWGGIEIAQLAKNINPQIQTVFGGVGATYLWHHFLSKFKAIDYVVLEEGEYTFLELIQNIEIKKHSILSQLKGLALRVNNKPYRTAKREPITNIDELPDPSQYFNFQHVALTRGCPGNCTFCGSPDFWKRRVRFHSANYFVQQLERLHKNGIDHFFFCDDTFTLKKELIIEVCRKIISRRLNITWVAISKVTAVDAEVLNWMRKAGCTQISYGIESGNKKIRQIFGKKLQDCQIETAFSLTTHYGILPRAYFIYGAPGETFATISETVELIFKIKPLSAIFYILTLFPGTALYNLYQKKNTLNDDIWLKQIEDILYFETDPKLSKEIVFQFGKILRQKYYSNLSNFVKEIDLIDLPEFYPLHADFLSRLAMTFSHGDYATIDLIPNKEETAIQLYQKALKYNPNHRAYLGLGTLYQKKRQFMKSVDVLRQGIIDFPNSQPLNICLGISYMNIEDFRTALVYFEKFSESRESRQFIPICQNAIANANSQ
jgi:radical SAM superfamily enzyme YgiQ (UPF0313 family)